MKKILVLNCVSLPFWPIHQWLDLPEIEMYMLAQRGKLGIPVEELLAKGDFQLIEEFDHYSTNDFVELRAVELAQEHQFSHIIALSEFDILRAARLREKLNIPNGQDLESAFVYRDKVKMKEHLQLAGIPIPPFQKIESAFDVSHFLEKNDFPIVIKPTCGAGSVQASIIRTSQDLEAVMTQGVVARPDRNIMTMEVEKFIEGQMHHIDGLVINEEIMLSWPSVYVNDTLSFHENRFLGSYLLSPENPLVARLNEFVKRVIVSLPSPENFTFHAEVFHTSQDELVFCEIASRTGGARVSNVMEEAFGENMNKLVVQSQTGCLPKIELEDLPKVQREDFPRHSHNLKSIPEKLCGWMILPKIKGTVKAIPSQCPYPWVLSFDPTVKAGDVCEDAHSSVDPIASCVIEGSSEEKMRERIQQVSEWFEKNLEMN